MRWEYEMGWRMLRGGGGGLRHLITSPLSVLSLLGVAFCLAATLISLSVMTGFEKAYKKAILAFNAHLVLISPEPEGGELQGLDLELKQGGDSRIEAVSPFVFREGLGLMPEGVAPVMIKGVDPQTLQEVYPLKFSPAADISTLFRDDGSASPPVVVGRDLFEKFFPGEAPPGAEIRIRVMMGKGETREFRVVGTFESGLYEFDGQFALVPIQAARRLFNLGEKMTGIEVAIKNPDLAPQMARELEKKWGHKVQVISWDELNEELFSAMQMEKTLFVVIMALILLIAGFNIVGVIVMLVLARRREIATLWALGGSSAKIAAVFAFEGFVIASIGVILGTLISFALLTLLQKVPFFHLDPEIYFLSRLPVAWPFSFWGAFVVMCLVLCYFIAVMTARGLIRRLAFHQKGAIL